MSIVYGPIEKIGWRGDGVHDKEYEIMRQPTPKDEMDTERAWKIKLHDYHPDYEWRHTELWVKWDGLTNKKLQMIHGYDYGIDARESYLPPELLHEFVHEYADEYNLTPEQKAYALDGLELALHLLSIEE
jgi:hypothetical protein